MATAEVTKSYRRMDHLRKKAELDAIRAQHASSDAYRAGFKRRSDQARSMEQMARMEHGIIKATAAAMKPSKPEPTPKPRATFGQELFTIFKQPDGTHIALRTVTEGECRAAQLAIARFHLVGGRVTTTVPDGVPLCKMRRRYVLEPNRARG